MQGFIALQLWCGPETFAAGRAGAAGRRAAVEPQVMNGMLPLGGERALPKGLWRIDTGDGNLELVPDTKTPRIRGLRIGLATLHTEGLVFRLAVVGGGVETANGERASRVFFAGRMPDGAFVDGDSEALAVVRIPREMPWSGAFRLVSYDAAGGFVADRSVVNPWVRECPDAPELNCVSSPRVLLVPEAIEEPDAPAGTLAMEARLGGRLAVAIGATELASAPVCRPGGAACGFAVRIRPVLVRSSPGGSSVFQGTPGAVREAFRERLERVLRPWESCGIRPLIDPVRIVDPPTKTLLSFGLPFGLVSDGRETLAIQLRHAAVRASDLWTLELHPLDVKRATTSAFIAIFATLKVSVLCTHIRNDPFASTTNRSGHPPKRLRQQLILFSPKFRAILLVARGPETPEAAENLW